MDAKEVEKCIDEFGTDIYRFCLKLCMNKTEAEDLYQQTFLKALEGIWSLDWEKNPKALLFSLPTIFGKATGENRLVEIPSLLAVLWTMRRQIHCIQKKI